MLSRIVSCFSAGSLGSYYYFASSLHVERKGGCLLYLPSTGRAAAEPLLQSKLPSGLQHYTACTALHITALTRKTREASALPLQRPSSTSMVFSCPPCLPKGLPFLLPLPSIAFAPLGSTVSSQPFPALRSSPAPCGRSRLHALFDRPRLTLLLTLQPPALRLSHCNTVNFT